MTSAAPSKATFPVIDLCQDTAAEQIGDACTQLGFFAITNHGLAGNVVGDALATAQRFFAQPVGAKTSVAFPEPGYPYGYAPYRYEALASSLGNSVPPDLKETFSVGPDCLDTGPRTCADADEAWIRSPSRWPAEPADLRATWESSYRELSGLAARLLGLMATALDLPSNYFEPLIDHHTSAMRALHYPAVPADAERGALRASAHTDYGTLTILATDGNPGLEVLDPRQGWRAVPHIEGGLVVNLGDSIAQWTNERWRSTLHRVVLPDQASAERYSLAFFHMANWDAVIECLPSCRTADGAAMHEPVQAGPWLMRKFQATAADN